MESLASTSAKDSSSTLSFWDDTGVLESMQEGIHQEEQEGHAQEVSTGVRESMLVCYLLITEDQPESLSLSLSTVSRNGFRSSRKHTAGG
jgi:hypothetical protein